MNVDGDIGSVIVPITGGEAILRCEKREIGILVAREAVTITVSSGGLVVVPPEVAHSFRTTGDRPARWLTVHAPDGGFAAFMRGVREGVQVDWDIAPLPRDG